MFHICLPTAESVLIKMDERKVFHIAVLLSLAQMFHGTDSQCTAAGSEKSVSGWRLKHHTYKTMMAKLGLECALVCRQEDRCQSINFDMSVGMCEFNDRTKEAARPEDLVPDPDSYYYRRDIKRGKLVHKIRKKKKQKKRDHKKSICTSQEALPI